MKITLYSPTYWRVADDLFDPQRNELVRLEGSLDEIAGLINGTPTDLLVVHGFAMDERLLAEVGRLCRKFTDIAIVPHCEDPGREFLIQLMRSGVREVLLEETPESIREVLARIEQEHKKAKRTEGRRGTAIGLISAKGGDGSSMLAANLALAISLAPESTVLAVDLSLPFGDLDLYMTSDSPAHTLVDFSDEIGRLDASLLSTMVHRISSQLHLIASPKVFDEAFRIDPEHVRRLIGVALQEYDYVVLDFGSRVGPFVTSVLDEIDDLVMVATATMTSVRHASQLMRLWSGLEFDSSKVRLVLNRYSSRYNITPEQLSRAAGIPIEVIVQTEIDLAEKALLTSTPIVSLDAKCKLSKTIIDWSSHWTGQKQEESKSLWHRLKIK